MKDANGEFLSEHDQLPLTSPLQLCRTREQRLRQQRTRACNVVAVATIDGSGWSLGSPSSGAQIPRPFGTWIHCPRCRHHRPPLPHRFLTMSATSYFRQPAVSLRCLPRWFSTQISSRSHLYRASGHPLSLPRRAASAGMLRVPAPIPSQSQRRSRRFLSCFCFACHNFLLLFTSTSCIYILCVSIGIPTRSFLPYSRSRTPSVVEMASEKLGKNRARSAVWGSDLFPIGSRDVFPFSTVMTVLHGRCTVVTGASFPFLTSLDMAG